jgi:hypothetical protein
MIRVLIVVSFLIASCGGEKPSLSPSMDAMDSDKMDSVAVDSIKVDSIQTN